MNISYVFQSFPELSQTFVYDQMHFLKNHGHRIVASYKKFHKDHFDYIESNFYNELCDFSGFTFNKSLLTSVLLKGRSAGKNQCLIENAVNKMIADRSIPDVFVAHFGPNVLLAADLKKAVHLKTGKRIPVVGVFHGYDVSKYIQKHGASRYLNASDDIDLFIAISDYWKKVLIEIGLPTNKIEVIRLGVQLDKMQTSCSAHKNKILSIGRMVEKKGFDDLINAFEIARQTNNEIELEIIGDGPLLKKWMNLAAQKNLSKSITFLGAQNHKTTLEKLKSASLFALPSKTAENGDKEGIPVVLMEAMASKVPVVSTYHSGIPELIENDVSGLLVQERSPGTLAEAILRILSDSQLASRLSSEGWNVIDKNYNKSVQNVKFEETLKKLTSPVNLPRDQLCIAT